MTTAKQKTIAHPISYSGVGLHTGNKTTVTFNPAPPNSGVVFVRVDLPEHPRIKADVSHVVDVSRGTTIGINGVRVMTVEHIMAAIAGLELDNLIIEVDSNEPPVGDASALPFLETLLKAELVEQDALRRIITLPHTVLYTEENVTLALLPADELRITFTIEYNHPALGVQSGSFLISNGSFAEEIASARTFCFLKDVEEMKVQGLIKGGSLENAVVIGDHEILNDTLRFPDEFLRHKVLDLLGDLYLLGEPVRGHIIAIKSGHASHVKFTKRIREEIDNIRLGRSRSNVPKVDPSSRVNWDITEITKILPHRYPFLLVDKIIALCPKKYALGIKNVTINEPFFQGHWPGNPVMPGVLIVEAMAQVGACLMLSEPLLRDKVPYFLGFDKVKFRRAVKPGDQLLIYIDVIHARARSGKMRGTVMVDGEVAAEGECCFYLGDKQGASDKSK